MTTASLLQQAFVLATGLPADAQTLAEFETMIEEDGNYSRVAAYFEAQLGALAAQQGVVATVQQLAFQGLGITLSDGEAQAVTQSLMAQGIDTWTELLVFVIDTAGGSFDVLDRRADAAAAFLDALEANGGSDLFEGDAVDDAVRALLQSIDGSQASYDEAVAGLQDLADELVDDDTDPDPDPEPEPDTQAPAAPVASRVSVDDDGRIAASEAGSITVKGTTGTVEAGAKVLVSIDDKDASTHAVTAQATAAANGSFRIDSIDVSGLADGMLTITLTATDAAGNVSASSSVTAFKDTTGPAAIDTGEVAVSGDNRILVGEAGSVSVSGDTHVGNTVYLTIDDANADTPAISVQQAASADGFSFHGLDLSSLDDGTLGFTFQAQDTLGNWSAVSSMAITKDTVAPEVAAASISVTSTGTGASGTYAAGDTVTVAFDPSGNSDLASVTVDFSAFGGGSAVAASLHDGVYAASYVIASGDLDANVKASVTATDVAGNTTTTQDDTAVAVDNRAPTVSVSSSATLVKEGESATITFTFSEDPGASFTLDDVSANGGTLTSLAGSGLTRTATFTATAATGLITSTTVTVADDSYTDANGNEGSGGSVQLETVFNDVLFVGNSATFGRVDPVMSYNTWNALTNPGGVHDLTAPTEGGAFANPTGTNNYEPHPWGGVPGLVDAFADQVGLNWDVSLSTRNAATLRGHYLNTSPAGWDMRGNIAQDEWDIVVLQDQTDEPLPGGFGSITFAPGSSTATLVITPTGDTVNEYTETLSLALQTSSTYRVASTSSVTTQILNDDPSVPATNPALPTVTLSTSGSVMEDGASNIVFTFTASQAVTSDLVVTFFLDRDGSTSPSVATSGAGDFDIYSGSPNRFQSGGAYNSNGGTISYGTNKGTITIKAGQTTATWTLDPKADVTVENSEGMYLSLVHADSANPLYNIGTQGIVSAAILNDDFASGTDLTLPNVTMSVSSASAVYENSGNALVYTFTRSGDTTNALTVNFKEDGTATLFAEDASRSDFSVSATGGTASLVTTSGSNADTAAFEQYATLIEDYIHTGTPGGAIPDNTNASAETDVYLYATWARPDMIDGAWDMITNKELQPDGSYNGGAITQSTTAPTAYYLTLEAMSEDLTAAYEHLAEVNTDFVDVAPVSTAFMAAVQAGIAIRDPYTEDAEALGKVNLWFDDNLHASKYGSYLAGLTLFSTLTGLDARVLGAGDRVAQDLGIDADTAVALQGIASATLGFDADLAYTAPGSVTDLGGSGDDVTLATAGAYSFRDGTHTEHDVTVQSQAGNWGTLEAVVRSDGHQGQVNWIYTVNNEAVDPLLATGQEHVDTFTVTLDDGHGGSVVEIIGVSVFGG